MNLVRRSCPGVVSWTCDQVLALGKRFDSPSWRSFCCNPLRQVNNCNLVVLDGAYLKQEVLCMCTHYTALVQDPISFFEKEYVPVVGDDG